MASSSYSDYACVVWRVNSGQLSRPSTQLISNSFTLFGSERKFILLANYYNSTTTLKLEPPFSFNSSGVQVSALVTVDNCVSRSLNKTIHSQCECYEILTFSGLCSSSSSYSNKRTKIVCIFQLNSSVSQNSSESEIICFTSKKPSPQTPNSKLENLSSANDSNLENLSSDFGKFLKDATFTDVTLKCHDSTMSAHRSVLAARSPVFAAMFRNKMAECKNGVVEMDDLDPDVLELFLKFLYSGKIRNLSEKNVSILFSTSDKYDVPRLQQQCSKWIIENLTLENCIGFLQLADTHNCNYLKNSVVEFIVGHASVFQKEEWSQFKGLNSKLAIFVYEKYIRKLSNIKIA